MPRISQSVMSCAFALVFSLSADIALADAIDGNWCYRSRHLAIEGRTILTPGGTTMTGNYSRHGFIYTAPAGEVEAGSQVFMVLLDEETMEFRAGSESATPQVWHRCTAPSS